MSPPPRRPSVCANFHNAARIDVIAYLSEAHDALLMSDIKNGAQCHVQLEFNLTLDHDSFNGTLRAKSITTIDGITHLFCDNYEQV